MKTATYIYNLLLQLYPRSYRNAFGAQMLQTFVDQYTDVATSAGRVSMHFWVFTVTDEMNNITRQHIESIMEAHPFLQITVPKLVVSAVLLIPLYAVCYAALVTASLVLPHPHVSGLGFLLALAALVLLSGVFSVVASYVLASTLVRVFPTRNMNMS